MEFKVKALVAAVAFAAIAGQAVAAPVQPTATTPSDVIFFAIDQAAGTSFAFNLGSVAHLTGLNQNITGSAWNSFVAAEGGVLDNVTWGIAYDQGIGAPTSQWGTTVTDGKTIGSETSTKMNGGRSAFTTFISQAGNSALNAGTGVYTNAGNASNFTVGVKNNWGGNAAGFTTDNFVGTDAAFYTVTQATSAAGGTFVGNFSFNGTNVAVAAVPEPETYAMFLAGLGMVGAMVRRRKQA